MVDIHKSIWRLSYLQIFTCEKCGYPQLAILAWKQPFKYLIYLFEAGRLVLVPDEHNKHILLDKHLLGSTWAFVHHLQADIHKAPTTCNSLQGLWNTGVLTKPVRIILKTLELTKVKVPWANSRWTAPFINIWSCNLCRDSSWYL